MSLQVYGNPSNPPGPTCREEEENQNQITHNLVSLKIVLKEILFPLLRPFLTFSIMCQNFLFIIFSPLIFNRFLLALFLSTLSFVF